MLDPNDRTFLLHMRGLFDCGVLASVLSHFKAVEAERQAIVQSDRDQAKLRTGQATDALRFDARWYDPWRDRKLAEVFEPFTWVMFPAQIRHITDDYHLVPWHQDQAYMELLPRRHARVITCFLPLEPDPTRASTLEFAVGLHEPISHRPIADHGAVMAEPDTQTRSFDLEFGDALVFGDHVPHRTIPSRDGRIDRRSFEFRLVMPGEALADKDYFDIRSGCFVRTDGSAREFP